MYHLWNLAEKLTLSSTSDSYPIQAHTYWTPFVIEYKLTVGSGAGNTELWIKDQIFCLSDAESHSAAQAGLKLMDNSPVQSPKCWNYRQKAK